GSLPDGSRVNASLTQDVTTKGPTFSIRKFQETPYSAIDLIDLETANFDIMAYFWFALEYQKSILVSGGTATGKTTFLNSIVTFIPPEQKIVSIEDTRELQLPHENWIPSVAREGFGSGENEEDVTMYKLLKESFRQNPDYVVVGEVRGEEASVLFQGMSSGHPSLGTIHASSPNDVVKRLTTPPIDLSPSLVETLDIIVIMTKARQYGENARRVKAVYEVEAITPEGSPRTNEYISWTPIDDTFSMKKDSNILSGIKQQFGFSQDELEQEIENRKKVLEWMHRNGYTNFSEVARIVSEYYKDKDSVLDAIEKEQETAFEEVAGSTPSGTGAAMPADLQEAQQQLAQAKQQSEAAEAIKQQRKEDARKNPKKPGTGPETPVSAEELEREEQGREQKKKETDGPGAKEADGSSDQGDRETEDSDTGSKDEGGEQPEEELFGDVEEVEENPFSS
ncbi:MAG: type II/IV secretion system ATPase subunit, partial [Candidatus Nanohaloarchaea archaeon]|nr:type II/IV secretion system ATPase subunit [Candidatus Nanohaloarchaea archaeon]